MKELWLSECAEICCESKQCFAYQFHPNMGCRTGGAAFNCEIDSLPWYGRRKKGFI